MFARMTYKDSDPKRVHLKRFVSKSSLGSDNGRVVLTTMDRHGSLGTPLLAHHRHMFAFLSCRVLVVLVARAVELQQLTTLYRLVGASPSFGSNWLLVDR